MADDFESEDFPFYYMFESVLFDEDYHHEFKGHRSIASEELPASCVKNKTFDNRSKLFYYSGRSRQCVSKAINGFLNSEGGCVYLGITDDGTVRGIQLTSAQKDHIELNVQDLMERYNPAVPSEKYKVKFIPVFLQGSDVKTQMRDLEARANHYVADERAHQMRTFEMCWCDTDAEVKLSHNKLIDAYIVEIHVLKFKTPPLKLNTVFYDFDRYFYPIYETEENACYFRREASVVPYSHQEIYAMSSAEAEKFCLNVIAKLEKERNELEKQMEKKN